MIVDLVKGAHVHRGDVGPQPVAVAAPADDGQTQSVFEGQMNAFIYILNHNQRGD